MGSFTKKANAIAAKLGESPEAGRAILAAGAQKASNAAKRANPNLQKVSGVAAPPPLHHRYTRGK